MERHNSTWYIGPPRYRMRISLFGYVGFFMVLFFCTGKDLYAQSQSTRYYSGQVIKNRLSQMGLCPSRTDEVFKLLTTVSIPVQPKANVDSFLVGYNVQGISQELRTEGVDEDGIPNMLNKYVAPLYRGFLHDSTEQRYIAPTPVTPQSGCTNPGFETGDFTGWSGTTGCDTLDPSSYYYCYPFTPGIVSGRQTITSGTGTDPYGGFPVVNPNGGGSFSAQLGNANVGGQSEQLIYTFVVDNNSLQFTYWYAVVLEDPSGHSNTEQPWFQVNMNVNGQDVPCGDYFVAGNNATGFSSAPPDVVYKAWTPVTVDLSPYVGQTVTLTFTTADCSLGGHFGYAYIDCSCDPESILQNHQFCHVSDPVQLSLPGFGSYQWSTGETTPTISVDSAGVYSVQTTTLTGCPGPTVYDTISLYPSPTANYTDNVNCAMQAAFTNTSTVSGNTTISGWQWDFGDGSPIDSANQNPIHNYTAIGTYPVQLIVTTNNGCQDTISQNVTIPVQPTAQFSNTTVCLNNVTNFTDQSTANGSSSISSWNWDFGEPLSAPNNHSTLQNPTHTYSNPGVYSVTELVTNSTGCVDSITKNVYVNPLPSAQYTGTNVCLGSPTDFLDSSYLSGGNITGWSWNFGETSSGPNNISSQQNPSHTYANAGVYSVILTVTSDSGCQSTITHNVTVYPLPVASFTSSTVCYGDSTQLTDLSTVSTGSITSWDWDFGDGSPHSSAESPKHLYASNGTYTVILNVTTNGGCQAADTETVVVNAMPVALFSATNVCLNVPNVFTDESTIPAPGTINSWSWNFGDASPLSNVQSPTHTYSSPGTYTVSLTVTSTAGCDSTYSTQVTVYPLPKANFTNTNVCDGTTTTFTDSSYVSSGSIASWQWDLGDGATSTTESPTHLYNTPGNYSASLLVTTDHGCKDSITKPVAVYYNPVVAFSVDSPEGCAIHCVNLTDSSSVGGGDSLVDWLWNFGDGNYSTDQNPAHCYPDPGTYSVGLTVTSNHGCQTSYTHPDMITVWPLPTAQFTFGPQPTSIVNPVIHFTDQSLDAVLWHWSFGDGDTLGLTTENPVHAYEDTGRYTATLIVYNQYGCKDTISHDVLIGPEFTFYIPNAFSPNGDGVNDYFYGKGVGIIKYQMWIFDRWGNLIFHGTSLNDKWDGKVQGGPSGQMVQEDVYVWLVKLEDVFHKNHRYIGHVSVIK